MLREECRDCGHHKSTHHRTVESSGDVTQERRLVYTTCLASHCECRRYVPPKK